MRIFMWRIGAPVNRSPGRPHWRGANPWVEGFTAEFSSRLGEGGVFLAGQNGI